MQLGFVGLGRMGGNMALRLTVGSPDGKVKGGHAVVGFAKDPNPDLVGVEAVTIVDTLDAMVAALVPPRAVWVMVPAGTATESVITELAKLLQPGDMVIDGGNSFYKDSIRRAEGLQSREMGFLDIGTSGGIWGREIGYCMMAGGDPRYIAQLKPILDTLAPAGGWAHVGPSGAGHFVKMIHNGVEYGLMEAYGEGFEILYKSQFGLNIHQIAQLWNRGSVVRSWLLELGEAALARENSLQSIQPWVEDSGEGRWTVAAAIEEGVPSPVIAASLFARFASRDPYNFSARFAAALRNEFGGHAVKKVEEPKIQSDGSTQ